MTNNQNQPNQYDAVLGGNAPPPIHGAVLGGIEGVKKRLASSDVEAQIAALKEVLNYEDMSLDLVIDALESESIKVRTLAYEVLRQKSEVKAQQAIHKYRHILKNNNSWSLPELLRRNGFPCTVTFANIKIQTYVPNEELNDIYKTAYYVTKNSDLDILLQDSKVSKIEALVFNETNNFENNIISASNKLLSLKALSRGYYNNTTSGLIYFSPFNICSILEAYPNLELLKIGNACGLEVSPFSHKNLKALIIESSEDIGIENINQILCLNLPQLSHLELWLGKPRYGNNFSLQELEPILQEGLFPQLIYLGLRCSKDSDIIGEAIANSSEIEFLKILDLSMGSLTDKGAEALLNCPQINQLEILNVSKNFLSEAMVKELQKLKIQVIASNQKKP